MGNVADEILAARGLEYDELNPVERDQYYKWLDQEQKAVVTLDDVKNHVVAMKNATELQLVMTEPYTYFLWFKIPNIKHFHLKARLHNYILLEGLLLRPDRAKELLETYKKPTGTTL